MATFNETPSAERIHIGFFGVRNAGKSSLVNAVTGQDLAVVSDVAGTTTDPVRKAMELLPAGPVLVIDTPGIDDEGGLGQMRVAKARRVLNSVDVAVLAVDATRGMGEADRELVALFEDKQIPYLVALTKCDAAKAASDSATAHVPAVPEDRIVHTSARTGAGIHELKEAVAHLASRDAEERRIVSDLLAPGDCLVLVCPIDESAPKGRLILPQQQTIRDIIGAGCTALVCQDTELQTALDQLANPPRMVVTDSQVFGVVAQLVPDPVPLTSFSILMARYKGTLDAQVDGAVELDRIRDRVAVEGGWMPRIFMAEGCTHHRQCEDIGTVKLPRLIRSYIGGDAEFAFSSGTDYPEDLTGYDLVVHCGGCMVTEREMLWRARHASAQGVPFTNYGIAIAKITGILDRSLAALAHQVG